MPFVKIEGIEAMIYMPDDNINKRKNNCKDCYVCQWCSDERCEACLKSHCRNACKDECGL